MVAEVLAALERRPARAHLVMLSDFDGTLATFNVDPSKPTLRDETRLALEALSSREDVTVGLVSGRRLEDLDRRTALPPEVYLAGLHGLEIRHCDSAWHHPHLPEAGDAGGAMVERMTAA